MRNCILGLDDRLRPYVSTFLNNGINGHRLMMLAPDDLSNLNITKLGHQELILEMVEQLQYSVKLSTFPHLYLIQLFYVLIFNFEIIDHYDQPQDECLK